MRLTTLILFGIAGFFAAKALRGNVSTGDMVRSPVPASAPASMEFCELDAEVPDVNFSDDHDPDAGAEEVDAWVDPDAWVTPKGVHPGE